MNKEDIQELIATGHLKEAKKGLEHSDVLHCSEIELLSMRAAIAVYEGDILMAERYLLEGIAIQEDSEDLLFNMGVVQQILGNFEVAIQYYVKLLEATNDGELKHIVEQKIIECNEQVKHIRRPLVSIVLLAYNKLEYTQMCVESIFQHSSHIDFELIAVNNGSTDETHTYFNALPYPTRPLHLPKNQGVVGGFNAGMQIARGKYTAAVCNDFIFTPRWLDNLLLCIESDEKIGYVSPGASSISNYQQIPCQYSTIDELYEFAEHYNRSDSHKWEERVRLLPNVLMARSELLKQVGYYDQAFYYGEFADDDISFKIRRAGYKLVYCRDTFTHHFGSVTVATDQLHNNSMAVSRQIFEDKYGFDSWEAANFHPIMLGAFSFENLHDQVRILGINTNCGSNPLQLKNMLRSIGVTDVEITNYYLDSIYQQDLETVSDKLIYGELNQITTLTGEEHRYSFIILELETEQLQSHNYLLIELSKLLNANGQIACRIRYKDLNEEAMANDINHVKASGYEVRRTKIDPNIVIGYEVLITAQWRG